MKIRAVIGAGYGDEGKGLTTDYFCEKLSENGKVLNIKFNGGAQGGHTVERIVNSRYLHWVFAQYGAGTFAGADTFLGPKFQVDVELMLNEKEHLENMTDNIGNVYIDRRCPVSIPVDKIFNQTIEEARGELRHGSCGLGIFETFVRNNRIEGTALRIGDLFEVYKKDNEPEKDLLTIINKITDMYFEVRKLQLCDQLFRDSMEVNGYESAKNDVYYFNTLLKEEMNNIEERNKNFVKYLIELFNTNEINIVDGIVDIEDKYDSFVFEGEQGLELSTHTKENGNHTTPSDTGVGNIMEIINKSDKLFKCKDKEFIFITRSYKTKHGAGKFKEYSHDIDKCHKIVDFTNTWNDFQGSIRFGVANMTRTKELIQREINKMLENGFLDIKTSVMITHLDQTFGFIVDAEDKEYGDFVRIPYKNVGKSFFGVDTNMYYSFGPRALDIITL